jgi:hypothetical protein
MMKPVKCLLSPSAAAAIVAVLLFPGTGNGQAFDQTSVTFSFADDNVLKDSGETRKNSPDAYFGGQSASSLDRLGGSPFQQTATRLVVGKQVDTGIRLYPEGAVKLRFNANFSGDYGLADDGTYLALNLALRKSMLLKLSMFPVDADRLRLGYHYDISWGGTNTFPKNFRKGRAPGLVLAFDSNRGGVFAAMKTALIRSPSEEILDNPGGNTNQFVERSYYAALVQGWGEPVKGLRLQVGGGYFEKGTNTRANVLGKKIDAWGIGGALSYRLKGEVGKRLDLRQYYQDPEQFPLNVEPANYDTNRIGFQIAFEGNALGQVLEDPDYYGSTKREWSKAFYLSTGLRVRQWRLFFDALYRDLTYIVYNVPGFVPYQALPENSDLSHGGSFSWLPEGLSGEWFLVLSTDYFFRFRKGLGLMPALSFGMLLPATYMAGDAGTKIQGPYPSEHAQGTQKVVVRGSNSGDWGILPAGADELPVFILKFDLKFNVSRYFSLVYEFSYANDPNYAQVKIDSHGHAVRDFDEPHIVSMGFVSEMTF